MNNEEDIMGREQRAKDEKAIAILNATIGPSQAFDAHRGRGCPKCSAKSETFTKRWCPGTEVVGAAGPCREFGQHLHVMCATCQYQWREECADAEANRAELERLAENAAKQP